MDIETFIRDHIANGNSRLVFEAAIDPHTNKVTAIFEDTDKDGQTAHVRIEGSHVIFQSWDTDGEGKPELPKASEAKDKAAAEAAKPAQKAKA